MQGSPTTPLTPLVVYGSTASYYTGKLEAYLRAKGISYRLEGFTRQNMRRCAENTGVTQIPQVECADGSWLVDTTLIIEYFERTNPEPQVTPSSAPLAFISRLIEDYADEWLWRPAMHYRWSYPGTAHLMSAWLAEHLVGNPGPQWLKRLWWRRRQSSTFVTGDGVTPATRSTVEAAYLDTLAYLEPIFAKRPFVLGERPTEADFGLFGPLFRHFFSDPAPARIMRERAPGVHEWVARMWNLQPHKLLRAPMPESVPEDIGLLVRSITAQYLPYLEANAAAYANGQARVSYRIADTTFAEPTKPYRVWCRDRLRTELLALNAADRATLEAFLESEESVARLAVPSAKTVDNIFGELPLSPGNRVKTVDSWWR